MHVTMRRRLAACAAWWTFALAAGVAGAACHTDGGIGGTGTQANGGVGGTGIVGIITGFASVCVNGVEVDYDGSTPVTRNGRTAKSGELRIGEFVAIEAAPVAGRLTARRIDILHSVAGPVTDVKPAERRLRVMGQAVQVTARTQLDSRASLESLRPGMLVQVSGLRDVGGVIIATRVDQVEALAEHTVFGVATRPRHGGFEMHGTRVAASPELMRDLHDGDEALARGRWDGALLRAHTVHGDHPSLPFAGRVERVIVEGLVHERRGARELRVGYYDVTLSRATRIDGDGANLTAGRRVRVSGRLGADDRISAEHLAIERDNREAPRRDPKPGARQHRQPLAGSAVRATVSADPSN